MEPYKAHTKYKIRFNLSASFGRILAAAKGPRNANESLSGGMQYVHCAESARRLHIQAAFAPGMLLGVRVIDLGAASGGLLPIAGALKDILLVGIAAELLGAVGDVDDRGDVGDQCGD